MKPSIKNSSMRTISEGAFAAVCYTVLMQNGPGISDKAPDYIEEKKNMFYMGYEAFNRLDLYNMRKVKEWCKQWDVEMPQQCAEYLDSCEAAFIEMQERMPGFEL